MIDMAYTDGKLARLGIHVDWACAANRQEGLDTLTLTAGDGTPLSLYGDQGFLEKLYITIGRALDAAHSQPELVGHV